MSGLATIARRAVAGLAAAAALQGCRIPTEALDIPRDMPPQSVVLLVTPKILPDFDRPEAGVARFLDHYAPLTTRAGETIVIFAVGNSDHILRYRGLDRPGPGGNFWADSIEWARTTDGPYGIDDTRGMNYYQLAGIVRAFKRAGAARGLRIKVYDQIDSSIEFTTRNDFKYHVQPACMDWKYHSYDIRGVMRKDPFTYATADPWTTEGRNCGEFLVDQAAAYMRDLDFDGVFYGNQLGTRGQWLPENGPGYSDAEATAIRDFLAYSKRKYGHREVMWFDSYNHVPVERSTFSFPSDGYGYFDYLLASGFCIITFPERYIENLESKIRLRSQGVRVLATLDYVDPWYSYNSMTEFPEESARLEAIAIEHRAQLDGVMFFANDDDGSLVPRARIEAFARAYFGPRWGDPLVAARAGR